MQPVHLGGASFGNKREKMGWEHCRQNTGLGLGLGTRQQHMFLVRQTNRRSQR